MTGKAVSGRRDYTTCECGKRGYMSKKDAKAASKALHPGSGNHVYACESSGLWHFGHLPVAVLNRGMDRSTLRRSPRRPR